MCTNKIKIKNKYTGKEYYVKCGDCPSCRQEKADLRTARILSQTPKGYTWLFFHLTYMDEHVPFFYLEDLNISDGVQKVCVNNHFYTQWNSISIYRYCSAFRYFNPHTNNFEIRRNYKHEQLADYYYRYCSNEDLNKFFILPDNRVACLFYKDVQDFFKRLRQNYARKTKYHDVISKHDKIHKFVCGEYGETNSRCHWHVLLCVPQFERQYLYKWRELIAETWLFADYKLTYDNVDFAIAGASYASSYVNCSTDISSFLQRDDFKPCWHYSVGFGCDSDDFDFDTMLSKIEKRDLSFNKCIIGTNGVSRDVTTTIPSYFTNRFFPKFKGMCYLNYEQMYSVIAVPSRLVEYRKIMKLKDEDINEITMLLIRSAIRFVHAQKTHGNYLNLPREPTKFLDIYKKYAGESYEFAYWFVKFLIAKNSTRFRLWYRQMTDDFDFVQSYDNIEDFKKEHKREYLVFKYNLPCYKRVDEYVVNCNQFKRNVFKTQRSSERYRKKIKQRKVTQLLCPNP